MIPVDSYQARLILVQDVRVLSSFSSLDELKAAASRCLPNTGEIVLARAQGKEMMELEDIYFLPHGSDLFVFSAKTWRSRFEQGSPILIEELREGAPATEEAT